MTLREAIYGLLEDLDDLDIKCKNTTFTLNQIKRYLIEGRCLIQEMNPEFYTELRIFKLDAGSTQRIGDCSSMEVVGQADCESCEVICVLKPCVNKACSTYNQGWAHCEPECPTDPCDDFTIDCYIWLNRAEGVINVYPPIPENCDICLAANCQNSPELDLDDELAQCKDVPALMQWALYRASMVDAEDPSAFSAAQIYLQTFANLTSIKLRKLDDKLNKKDEQI